MNKEDFGKIVEFIEGNYSRTLAKNELVVMKEELKDYTYESFMENIKYPLLKKVDYFKVQALHKIIEEDKELQDLKESLGIKSFDELYEN